MPQTTGEFGCRQRVLTRNDVAKTLLNAMADYRRGVGERLESLRRSRNLSQEKAAQLVDVSTGSWKNWERGRRSPTETNWGKIRERFKLSDDDVNALRGTPPPPLGLGLDGGNDPDQLDRIEAKVNAIEAKLDAVIDYLSGRRVVDAFEGLPPMRPEPQPGTPEVAPSRPRAARGRRARASDHPA